MIWYGSQHTPKKTKHNNLTVILLGLSSLYRRMIWYGSQHTEKTSIIILPLFCYVFVHCIEGRSDTAANIPKDKYNNLTVIMLGLTSLYRRMIWYGSQHTPKTNMIILPLFCCVWVHCIEGRSDTADSILQKTSIIILPLFY